MDLVETAEQLRKIQAQCNAYEFGGYAPLAYATSAWGDLDRAMKHILTQHYVTLFLTPALARRTAWRVLDEVYKNGEDIAYNMDLLKRGEIEI